MANDRNHAHSNACLSRPRVLHIFQLTSFNGEKYCYVGFLENVPFFFLPLQLKTVDHLKTKPFRPMNTEMHMVKLFFVQIFGKLV